MGMMSAVVVPMSMRIAFGWSSATMLAVAAQLDAATASGWLRASVGDTKLPTTVKTCRFAEGNALVAASSTKATPSRFVRNICESSAVIVIAWPSSADVPTPAANERSSGVSERGSRCISNGCERAASTTPARTRATLVFTPPMSQPITPWSLISDWVDCAHWGQSPSSYRSSLPNHRCRASLFLNCHEADQAETAGIWVRSRNSVQSRIRPFQAVSASIVLTKLALGMTTNLKSGMRIVGVIDVRGGMAVHALGGQREDYA